MYSFIMKTQWVFVIIFASSIFLILKPSSASDVMLHSFGIMKRAFRTLFNLIFLIVFALGLFFIGFCCMTWTYSRHFVPDASTNFPIFPIPSTIINASGDHQEEFFDIPEEIIIAVEEDESMRETPQRRRRRRMPSTLLPSFDRDKSRSTRRRAIRKSLIEAEEMEFSTPSPSPRRDKVRNSFGTEPPINSLHENDQTQLKLDKDKFYQINENNERTVIVSHCLLISDNLTSIKGDVILHQFPRGISKPCLSCDGMYLETYIRLIGIPCNVLFDCLDPSGPWISSKLKNVYGAKNGVEFLKKIFPDITNIFSKEEEKNVTSWCLALLIDHLYWGLKCWRWAIENAEEFKSNQPGWDKINKNMPETMRFVKESLWSMGFGKLSYRELCDGIIKDFEAFSSSLGEKSFLMGDTPTEIDCLAFSVLCQILWGHESILREKLRGFSDINKYCVRIRSMLWSDWHEQLSGDLEVKRFNGTNIEDTIIEDSETPQEKRDFTNTYYQLVHPEDEDIMSQKCNQKENDNCNSNFCSTKIPVATTIIHQTNEIMYGQKSKENRPIRIVQDLMHTQASGIEEYFDDNFEDMEIITYSSSVENHLPPSSPRLYCGSTNYEESL